MTPVNPLIEILITVPFPDHLLARIRETSSRFKVNCIPAKKPEDIPADAWSRAEVLYTDRIIPGPELVPNLHWVQFHLAGLDASAGHPLLGKPDLKITTLSGAASPQMAEYAMMMMLALGHHMPDLIQNQAEAAWPENRFVKFSPRELRGSTVGIVGYGSIGRQIARLLQPFDVTVLAAKRDAMHPEDNGYIQDGLGDPEGNFFHRLYPIQAIKPMLQECDFIVVTIPLTEETRGLISTEELAACKPGAYLIDVSRGGVVDLEALQTALHNTHIAGAALDVFSEEPLLPAHPLWKMPNVLITPHISSSSPYYNDRAVSLFIDNLNRYLVNLPLYNRFDPEKGY